MRNVFLLLSKSSDIELEPREWFGIASPAYLPRTVPGNLLRLNSSAQCHRKENVENICGNFLRLHLNTVRLPKQGTTREMLTRRSRLLAAPESRKGTATRMMIDNIQSKNRALRAVHPEDAMEPFPQRLRRSKENVTPESDSETRVGDRHESEYGDTPAAVRLVCEMLENFRRKVRYPIHASFPPGHLRKLRPVRTPRIKAESEISQFQLTLMDGDMARALLSLRHGS